MSNDYLGTEFAFTRAQYLNQSSQLTLTISETEGTYRGKPTARFYTIRLIGCTLADGTTPTWNSAPLPKSSAPAPGTWWQDGHDAILGSPAVSLAESQHVQAQSSCGGFE